MNVRRVLIAVVVLYALAMMFFAFRAGGGESPSGTGDGDAGVLPGDVATGGAAQGTTSGWDRPAATPSSPDDPTRIPTGATTAATTAAASSTTSSATGVGTGGTGATGDGSEGAGLFEIVIMTTLDRMDFLSLLLDDIEADPACPAKVTISLDAASLYDAPEWLRANERGRLLYHPPVNADDATLNQGFKGDSYGNPREARVVRLKHHWWWLMHEVWGGVDGQRGTATADYVLFLEDDLVASPDMCSSIPKLVDMLENDPKCSDRNACGGANLNYYGSTTASKAAHVHKQRMGSLGYLVARPTWDLIAAKGDYFCTHDDYNWDWTARRILGDKTLFLTTAMNRVEHGGTCKGLHSKGKTNCPPASETVAGIKRKWNYVPPERFVWNPSHVALVAVRPSGWGGWGHSYDHELCMSIWRDHGGGRSS